MSSDVKYDILAKCVTELMICFAQCTESALTFTLPLMLSASLGQSNSQYKLS